METVTQDAVSDILQTESQQDQVQNPCDYCTDNIGEDPDVTEVKEATHLIGDKCLGIPIKMNLCDQHFFEWKEMQLDSKTGGLFN